MTNVIGANVEELRGLSAVFADASRRVDALRSQVERMINAAWVGPDAEQFRQAWTGSHRAKLTAVITGLDDARTDIDRNVAEQEHASGATASSGALQGSSSHLQGSSPHLQGSSPHLQGPAATPDAVGASASPVAGASREFSWTSGSDWVSDWRRSPSGYDQWNFAFDGDGDRAFGNCTSFVAWRLNQLGAAAAGPEYSFTNNALALGDGERVDFGRLGHAYEWYGNAPASMRANDPAPGHVLVWERGDGLSDYGHVAIVREVRPDGSILIEQSSWDGYTYKEQVLAKGQYPNKFLDFLPR